MEVIIDTNLLFSSISKRDGRIAEIILNPKFNLKVIGCYFSYIELFKHKDKLLKASKLEEVELLEVMYQILQRVSFVNESTIPQKIFQEAFQLTNDIDPKDTVFVAMGIHLSRKIWSGDKVLVEGLRRKGFSEIILTHELLEILSKN